MRYGLDFGTSNSAIGLYRDGRVELAPVDPLAPNPGTVRTLLWIGRDGNVEIGEAAVRAFVAANAGRQIRRSRVWYNELIATEFGDEYIQFDADVDIPGRFFQALKTVLRDPEYGGTDVFGTSYAIEELVAIVLREIKRRADAYYGSEVDRVLLGRPVRFAEDAEADAIAQERLRRAAEMAGFRDIALLYEPLGAAFHYEMQLHREELALVFDFGGGTLDLSLVRLGPERLGREDRAADILTVRGVLLGGNTFNEDVMEARLMRHFGQHATWRTTGGTELPMPAHIYAQLRAWYTMSLLNERQTIHFIQEMRRATRSYREIDALISLIVGNYGWDLFQEIERAKCELSTARYTKLQFFQEAIAISELLTRAAYETIIASHLADIDRALDQVLADAGVRAEELGVVLRTGGASLTPCVQALLEHKFGAARVREQEVFTSVASGLAVAAGR